MIELRRLKSGEESKPMFVDATKVIAVESSEDFDGQSKLTVEGFEVDVHVLGEPRTIRTALEQRRYEEEHLVQYNALHDAFHDAFRRFNSR